MNKQELLAKCLAACQAAKEFETALNTWRHDLLPALDNTPYAHMLKEMSNNQLGPMVTRLYGMGVELGSCSDSDLVSRD